jgi:hypothetical protein
LGEGNALGGDHSNKNDDDDDDDDDDAEEGDDGAGVGNRPQRSPARQRSASDIPTVWEHAWQNDQDDLQQRSKETLDAQRKAREQRRKRYTPIDASVVAQVFARLGL